MSTIDVNRNSSSHADRCDYCYNICSVEDLPDEQPISATNVGSVTTVTRRSKRDAIRRMRRERERPSHQFVGVLRHTERADASWDLSEGKLWIQSKDFEAWPHDPPLSSKGLQAATQIGQRIREEVAKSGTSLHVVVSSPFLRCVQTAVEVCCELGEGTRLLIDSTLGEVFSPSIMGALDSDKRDSVVRPMQDILAICNKRGVACEAVPVGQLPDFPENLKSARRRFAVRFLTYLRRSLKVRRNFLIVSHADCVGAALSMMPSEVGSVLDKVDYGGMFLAQRPMQQQHQLQTPTVRPACPGRLPELDYQEPFSPRFSSSDENENHDCVLTTPSTTPRLNNPTTPLPDSTTAVGFGQLSSDDHAIPPKAADGWHVIAHGVSRVRVGHSGSLERCLNDLVVDGSFSRGSIEKLLDIKLTDLSLGTTPKSRRLRPSPTCESWFSNPSSTLTGTGSGNESATTHNSTLLFGRSSGNLDLIMKKEDKIAKPKQETILDECPSPQKQRALFSKAFSMNSRNSKIFQRRQVHAWSAEDVNQNGGAMK